MKKTFACIAVLAALFVAGCASADETRDVATFTQLEMGGNYSIEVRAGVEQLVLLKGSSRDLEDIKTEVRGGTLYIKQKRLSSPGRVDVVVDVKTLRSLSVGGKVDGRISGMADHDFDLMLAGSVKLHATGTCGDALIEAAGSVTLDASEFVCNRVRLEIAGSGDAAVHATAEVTIDISGRGRVDVYGNPARVTPSKFRGSATITLK